MKALVVYDSVFGNTEKVAQAMGEAIGAQTLRVSDVKPEHVVGLDVLVVGSPTRAFSPTPAIKRWVNGLPSKSLQGVKVGAFDTRMSIEDVGSGLLTFMVGIFGYAAKPIGDRLARKGGELVLSLEGFYVQDSEGPLKDGELERAADWVREML